MNRFLLYISLLLMFAISACQEDDYIIENPNTTGGYELTPLFHTYSNDEVELRVPTFGIVWWLPSEMELETVEDYCDFQNSDFIIPRCNIYNVGFDLAAELPEESKLTINIDDYWLKIYEENSLSGLEEDVTVNFDVNDLQICKYYYSDTTESWELYPLESTVVEHNDKVYVTAPVRETGQYTVAVHKWNTDYNSFYCEANITYLDTDIEEEHVINTSDYLNYTVLTPVNGKKVPRIEYSDELEGAVNQYNGLIQIEGLDEMELNVEDTLSIGDVNTMRFTYNDVSYWSTNGYSLYVTVLERTDKSVRFWVQTYLENEDNEEIYFNGYFYIQQ